MKRKRSDDDEGAQGQVLPVAALPDGFDPATAELDGALYLALVRRDAQALPHTTRVPNPYLIASAPAPAASDAVGNGDSAMLLPTDEWRVTFERRFRDFRANIRHTPIHVGRPPERVAVPGYMDRDGWWAFINGLEAPPKTKKIKTAPAPRKIIIDADTLMYDEQQEAWDDFVPTSRADAEYVPTSRADADLVPAARAADEWQHIYDAPEDGELPDEGDAVVQVDVDLPAEPEDGELPPAPEPLIPLPREPTRAVLECINHRTTLQLLKHYRHWLTLASSPSRTLVLSPHHARWLFALLAHLPAPAELVADEMAVLRQAAKAVLALVRAQRAWADEADSAEGGEQGEGQNAEEVGWWLAFAGVASGFGQRDLWDDARAALA